MRLGVRVVAVMIAIAGAVGAMAGGVDVDTLSARLDYQRWVYPQEKLHVMTDREQYAGGDTVWLRVFVADAASHQPVNASRYVYVELIDQMNNNVNRLKLINRKGVYKGYIPLDVEMTEGEYTLAAYTMFAEGLGQDFFFKKKIKVRSPYM
ncbi:MAG: hypothetical protein K2M76_00545, partial [Muribaculaceae bacterium]|nr:hypothetical protein [Muribaculaceae bacterium]